MPAWNDYKTEAKSRGAFAHELYVVVSTPAGDPSDVKEMLPAHLDYQAEQERRGALFLAGPMSDESGSEMQGVGLIVYQAPSLDAARELAEADPMHKSGARSFVLRRWLINEGSFTLSIGLSSKKIGLG